MEKEEIKVRIVGKYKIRLWQVNVGGWDKWYLEVRKGNKILVKTSTYGRKKDADDKMKNLFEEYKQKAIDEGDYKFVGNDFKIEPQDVEGWKMQKVNKYTKEVVDKNPNITTFEGFIRAYIHKRLDRKNVVGKYKLIDDGKKLVYDGDGRNAGYGQDVLVLELKDGRLIGNASKLDRCGSYRRGDEAPAQRVMFDLHIPMIPFNVFDEAKLDIQKAKVVDQGKEEDFILPRLEWNYGRAMLEPVNIYANEEGFKKYKTDDKKIILSQEETEIRVKVKTKKGNVKMKDGIPVEKKVPGWSCHYIDRKQLAERHFVGAMLLRVGKKYFLFDVDRNELKYYNFNPFICELPQPCKTIAEAYEMLKPKEVVKALKRGLKVQRQGEWFFIPTKKTKVPIIPKLPKEIEEGLKEEIKPEKFDLAGRGLSYNEDNSGEYKTHLVILKEVRDSHNYKLVLPKYKGAILNRVRDFNRFLTKRIKLEQRKEEFSKTFNFYDYGGELKAGNNRPNTVTKLFIFKGIHYCKGKVEHTGREHHPIELENWHIAIPNTAVQSFTITGNID